MITDDALKNMGVCSPLLPDPGGEVVRDLIAELTAERSLRLAAEAMVAFIRAVHEDLKYGCNQEWVAANIKAMFIDNPTPAPLAVARTCIYEGERANFILINGDVVEIGGASGHAAVVVLPTKGE